MKKMKSLSFVLVTLFTFSVSAKDKSARAELESPAMKEIKGSLEVMETSKGLKLMATVNGLKPGAVHGFHVHEGTECKGPDFKSAGGHFNPTKHNHSSPAAEEKHAGDMGNLVANKEGTAKTEVLIPKDMKVEFGSYVGKAVILHAKPDDLSSQPAGDAGDRIACGLIKESK